MWAQGVRDPLSSRCDGVAPVAGEARCSSHPTSTGLTLDRALSAAWEQDLKRLELGYEDEGYYNYKLQLMLGPEGQSQKWHHAEGTVLKARIYDFYQEARRESAGQLMRRASEPQSGIG